MAKKCLMEKAARLWTAKAKDAKRVAEACGSSACAVSASANSR